MIIRRKTPTVTIGNVKIGSAHPIAVQSMTNTPTANITQTLAQIKLLFDQGSDIVRVTINDEKAAAACEKIILQLRRQGYTAPIVGDFHYNGHLLLARFPRMAKLLDKYRINPGNLGRGKDKTDHFAQMIRIAIKNKKPVRIGVNAGSIDAELLSAHPRRRPRSTRGATLLGRGSGRHAKVPRGEKRENLLGERLRALLRQTERDGLVEQLLQGAHTEDRQHPRLSVGDDSKGLPVT
ncbi:MAG TPA: flavodoxin-dependent (E)-4-hydroxy-3-methylbut-2-enyl-diphosphate synthase, partial [Candidatus Omnitrophota bacterium]|nr:flavodoxin-dependent (E)-4-hydroxy-3-methylbut-2-enyl-diphosphate synthase [Candidatus Omnitrophota bacterium]